LRHTVHSQVACTVFVLSFVHFQEFSGGDVLDVTRAAAGCEDELVKVNENQRSCHLKIMGRYRHILFAICFIPAVT